MTEVTWEKLEQSAQKTRVQQRSKSERIKFLVGGGVLLVAVIYLVITATTSGAQYFISVHELVNNPDFMGQTVRISGAVIGDSIHYDSQNLIIDFTIADIPQDTNNLALTLHEAVINPETTRLAVHIENEVMPDLLQNEAQAILTGQIKEDGVFYATELLLKCPSRYGESVPEQVEGV